VNVLRRNGILDVCRFEVNVAIALVAADRRNIVR
jgi:hypothetical protein